MAVPSFSALEFASISPPMDIFSIFIKLCISYLHFKCYSLSWFPSQHPPNPSPSPSTWVFPSPSSPHYRPAPNNPVPWGGGGPALAGPRTSPSIGAPTRLFIVAYELGQSMYSLFLVPGSSGWLKLLFIWGLKPLQLFQSFPWFLQWGSHSQFSGLLLAFAYVFGIFRQCLSGEIYIWFLSACTSLLHPSYLVW